MDSSGAAGPEQGPVIDTSVANTARVWNYWLDGKDNYPVDRAVGDQIRALMPDVVDDTRAQRWFLVRAVRHLAGEAGIRQFLDIGTGLAVERERHTPDQVPQPPGTDPFLRPLGAAGPRRGLMFIVATRSP